MIHILNIINKLSEAIINEKGDLKLFALTKLASSGKWNLLIAANWCEEPSVEAFKYLYTTFQLVCEKYSNNKNKTEIDVEIDQFLEFPFVILREESNLVQKLKRLYKDKPAHITPVAINANTSDTIEEAYLFAVTNNIDRNKFETYDYGRFSIEELVA